MKATRKASVKKQAEEKKKPVESTTTATTTTTTTTTPQQKATILDTDLAKKAIHALYQHKESQSSNDLLESTSYLHGSITVKTLKAVKARSLKPFVFTVKHSPFPSDAEVCLIVQEDKPVYEKALRQEDMKNVKVYTLKELSDSYKRYEAKRKLAASFDVFLVDRRIISFIPKLFGKTFADRNKMPRPVALERKAWLNTIKRTLCSVTFHDNNGPVKSFKFSHMGLGEEEAYENLAEALPQILSKIPGGERNVQELGLRMDQGITLPIYNSLPSN
ncbi:ribosomal protein L1p/L10e family-domain-containing protein [Zychaea mexicana]|uniref:ribosomal protein L1p/L10e family-domain-containing protein n=1 Tax=Zychaea mexicana TaxID=64656 RepID=UPI0022FE3351|nr:ribosomal protein L1p/L10e family-domain-containing protein [Zychaea mexicana]KAI9499036.1 ribosomal protein L1p/L10e family-domain-containing protein [Zychaea mexicana]